MLRWLPSKQIKKSKHMRTNKDQILGTPRLQAGSA